MHQAGEHHRQQGQGGQQADPEQRRAAVEQGLPGTACGQVRDQRRAGGGGDQRGDHGQQPGRVGAERGDLVPGDHQIGDADRDGQRVQRARRPQHQVDRDGRAGAEHPGADGQGAEADREQRHRRTTVEDGGGRVLQQVLPGGLAVPGQVDRAGGTEQQQGGQSERPRHLGEPQQAGPPDREGGRAVRHDRRPHDHRVPVRGELGEVEAAGPGGEAGPGGHRGSGAEQGDHGINRPPGRRPPVAPRAL